VNYALTQDLIEALKTKMKYCALQIQNTAEAMFASTSLLSRFDDTGKVSTEDVIRYGFTGISAKASGVPIDSESISQTGNILHFWCKQNPPGMSLPGLISAM
jgi:NADH:ubiquinone oxidoreductase subunit D